MKEASIIGVNPAKEVFQLREAKTEGSVVFRKQILALIPMEPGCIAVMGG